MEVAEGPTELERLRERVREGAHKLKFKGQARHLFSDARIDPEIQAESDQVCEEMGELVQHLRGLLTRPLKRSLARQVAKTQATSLARTIGRAPLVWRHARDPKVSRRRGVPGFSSTLGCRSVRHWSRCPKN